MARWWVAIMLAVAVVACGHDGNKDFAAMNKTPLRTVCVGRMLVDLPKGGPLAWQQHFDYAEVSRLPDTVKDSKDFWALVQSKKDSLASQKHNTESSLLSDYLKVGDNAAMLLHRESESDVFGYDLDRYLWLGHWGYWFESKALLANSEKSQFPTFDTIFAQLEPIDNFQPPAKSGFCIDSALVTGKIGPIQGGSSVKVAQWKGVSIDVSTSENDGSRAPRSWEKRRNPPTPPTPFDDLGMMQDSAKESMKTSDSARIVSFEVMRKKERRLAGMDGQETAVKLKLANGQEYYRFAWGSTDDATRPDKSGFGFQLEAGADQYTPDYATPPSEDDLLALWDATLDSLKPRPGAR